MFKKEDKKKERKRECKEAALGQQQVGINRAQVGINWAKTSPRHLPLTAISFLVCTWANVCQQNTNLHRKKHLITWSHPPIEKEWRLRWQAAFAIVAMVSLTSDKERRRNNSPGKLRDFGESWSASDRSCTLSARNWNQRTTCLSLFQPTRSLFQYTSSFIIVSTDKQHAFCCSNRLKQRNYCFHRKQCLLSSQPACLPFNR